MPAPIDLTGQRFGKLEVLGSSETRDRHGRRVWRCKCLRCGEETTATNSQLRSGSKQSCGCLRRSGRRGRPFTRAVARTEHETYKERSDGGELWYAPRRAAEYAGVSQTTLQKWADRPAGKGRPFRAGVCPAIGRAIRTRLFPSGYNRVITYFAKADLDLALDARATRIVGKAPNVPDHVHVGQIAKDLGCHMRTVYRRAAAAGQEVEYHPGKDRMGRAMPRSYLPNEFAEEAKQAGAVPADKMAVKAAARFLGTTTADVHNLIAAGLLEGEGGKAITVAAARQEVGGEVLRYPRKCTLVPAEKVNRLKAMIDTLGATTTEQTRAGRPPGLLRRAAEALRDLKVSSPSPAANDGVPATHAPVAPAAESRTAPRETLPQQPYPVYIVQPPGQPVPVAFVPEAPPPKTDRVSDHPVWDGELRKLSWKEDLLKHFRYHPAENQCFLLSRFQDAEWKKTIPDPFNNPEVLNQTLRDLNGTLPPNTIRFCADGTGEKVCWDAV
jgi:hypothetical protein